MSQPVQDKLAEVFRKAFGLQGDIAQTGLRRDALTEWDSVGHMTLVSDIEKAFHIELSFEEVLALDSFDAAVEIVGRRQG